MKWVTRERPKIDRIACPWPIARFIDREPEFLDVPGDQVLAVARETGAVPCDALYAWCREGRGEAHRWPPAGWAVQPRRRGLRQRREPRP